MESLLPDMIRAAEILTQKKPKASFLLALAPTLEAGQAEKFLSSGHLQIALVETMTHDAIRAADLVIVASGTATLETAIFRKPMIITYRVSPLTYWVGKAMIKVKSIGMVNLVAGKAIVPELIQEEVRGERIAEEALRILDDENYRKEMIEELAEVGRKLGGPGAAERVARMALEMMT
jgi:lipid-A-disaccharide synthase